MAALLLYALPYIALFVLALRMPARGSLVILAALLGIPLAWLIREGFRAANDAPGGAGFMLLLVTLFLCTAGAGLLAGVATRAILLWRPGIRHSRLRCAIVVLSGALAIPAAFAGRSWWSEHERRLPDAACLAAQHDVTLAGAQLRLPSARGITPWTGEKELYSFEVSQRLRRFCGISHDGHKPVRLVHLMIEPEKLAANGYPLRDRFCATGHPLGKLLCTRPEGPGHDFPEDISLFVPGRLAPNGMPTIERGSHAAWVKEKDAADRSGRPLAAWEAGEFTRFSNGYWVARDASWKNDAGEPFTLYCYDTQPPGMLYCTASYRLALGPAVTYRLRARPEELASVAKTADRNFHALMRTLAIRQASARL